MEKYSIIEAKNIHENRDLVLELWEKVILHRCSGRFEWLYEQNPHGKAYTWFARDNSIQEIVGLGSVYPWDFYINGQDIKVGVLVDFGFYKKYWVYGPAVIMQRAITVSLKEKGFALGFVYPTDASSGVFLRAGFKSIGSASYWVKILRSEHIISKYIKVELLSKVLAVTVDKVLSVIDLRHRLGNPDKFITETIERCDRRFDILWEAEKLKYYIVPSHSASYLNWKFSDCKTTQYKYYCLFDEEKNSLKAFIIYALKNEEAIIKDIFPAHSAFLPYLLVKFSDTMRRNNIRSIRMAYLGNDLFKKVIRKSGFWETLTKRKNLLYSDENCATALKDGWLNKNNYYFFFG